MVKILISGDLEDTESWKRLTTRVNELQSSAHGPFDALILCGTVYGFDDGKQDELESLTLPLQTYALMKCSNRETIVNAIKIPNLTMLGPLDFGILNVAELNNLSIAYLNSSDAVSSTSILDAAKAISTASKGFDLLLTADWPRDMHHFLEESDLREINSMGIGLGGSKLSSAVSSILKPRYHFVSGKKSFFQRAPYRNAPAPDGTPCPCTRLISISDVSDSKDKKKKWLHALSLNPIAQMSSAEIADEPPGTTECPYVEVGQKSRAHDADLNPAKRMKSAEDAAGPVGGGTGKFFFGTMGVNKQPNQAAGAGTPSNTLFVGGLTREMLDEEIKQAIAAQIPFSLKIKAQSLIVKRPPGKAFAFVELPSVEAATKVIESTARRGGGGLRIGKRTLHIGWAKEKETEKEAPSAYAPPVSGGAMSGFVRAGNGANAEDRRDRSNGEKASAAEIVYERELIPPTSDSKVLFIGGLPMAVAIVPLQQSLDQPPPPSDPAPTSQPTEFPPSSNDDPTITPANTVEVLVADLLNKICRGDEIKKENAGDETASPVAEHNSSFVVKVNRIPGKTFAFVEMDGYDSAMLVISKSIKENFRLLGRVLTIGWAKSDPNLHNLERSGYVPPPTAETRVLFVGQLSVEESDESALRALIHDVTSDESSIVAIRRPQGKDYAFVEFSSPSAAQSAMRLLCEKERVIAERRISFGWAKGRPADTETSSADCWFCLASPSLKVLLIVDIFNPLTYCADDVITTQTHLVLSVADNCYVALPRGGVTDMHVMISPIDCLPSRLHFSAGAKAEFSRFQDSIEKLFSSKGQASIRFERALRTRGSRDHMQLHMVPLPLAALQGARAFQSFMGKVESLNLKFHEIQDKATAVDEVVLNMEGGPYQEYFYVELPVAVVDSLATYRRFVYVKDEKDGVNSRFPMSFGLELAAEVLGKPERGYWKNCIVSDEDEQALADSFRNLFSTFDFTLQ